MPGWHYEIRSAHRSDADIFPGGPPEWVPGLLNANGTLSRARARLRLGRGAIAGLGPFFRRGGWLRSADAERGALRTTTMTSPMRLSRRTSPSSSECKNFNMTANYTYSHTIDNGNFTTFINLPVNQFDYRGARELEPGRAPSFRGEFYGWRPHRLVPELHLQQHHHAGIGSALHTVLWKQFARMISLGSATDRVGGAPSNGRLSRCQPVQHLDSPEHVLR